MVQEDDVAGMPRRPGSAPRSCISPARSGRPPWRPHARCRVPCSATPRPKLLITVATTRLFFEQAPLLVACCAQMAMMWSPVELLPRARPRAITRSPSPSNARPTSAPELAAPSAASSSGCCDPQSSLMFLPSGSSWMAVTSAPSSAKIDRRHLVCGAVGAVEHDLDAFQGQLLRETCSCRTRCSGPWRRRSAMALPISSAVGRMSRIVRT